MDLKIKYFDENMPKLYKTEKGDWIDLRVVNAIAVKNNIDAIKNGFENSKHNNWQDNKIWYQKGDILICRLGIAIELPNNKKANIYPRSSTFMNWGLLLTNSVGCIDNSYCGNNDEWLSVFYCTRDGYIEKYDRLCQFDVTDVANITFTEVDLLNNTNRYGYGSTGKN